MTDDELAVNGFSESVHRIQAACNQVKSSASFSLKVFLIFASYDYLGHYQVKTSLILRTIIAIFSAV